VNRVKSEESPLARVVAVHEGAKAILSDSHQVNLRALDATVRSLRGGAQLRGFAEVSAQMRQWSQELHAAVKQVTEISADQVNLVSAYQKRMRMIHLLSAACSEPAASRMLARGLEQAKAEGQALETSLRQLKHRVRSLLEDLQQLGLMACVLSTSALIEAATAGADSKDLTIVSKDFAERSQKVTENIRLMLATDRQVDS
jgi:methyl-accepting chemotaxis protein